MSACLMTPGSDDAAQVYGSDAVTCVNDAPELPEIAGMRRALSALTRIETKPAKLGEPWPEELHHGS